MLRHDLPLARVPAVTTPGEADLTIRRAGVDDVAAAGLGRQGATKALVQAVRVASALRGKGIGARMMAWAADRARERGCALITLTTHRSRADAHRFYDRLGYQRTHLGYTLPL